MPAILSRSRAADGPDESLDCGRRAIQRVDGNPQTALEVFAELFPKDGTAQELGLLAGQDGDSQVVCHHADHGRVASNSIFDVRRNFHLVRDGLIHIVIAGGGHNEITPVEQSDRHLLIGAERMIGRNDQAHRVLVQRNKFDLIRQFAAGKAQVDGAGLQAGDDILVGHFIQGDADIGIGGGKVKDGLRYKAGQHTADGADPNASGQQPIQSVYRLLNLAFTSDDLCAIGQELL